MTGLGPLSVMTVMAVLLLPRILGLIWLNKCGDTLVIKRSNGGGYKDVN